MFTGIIETVGHIDAIHPQAAGRRVHVQSGALDLTGVRAGDSIAVSGVCLTVSELTVDGFWADVSRETLEHTTLAGLVTGACVNLEKALVLGARLGGHLVSGHVDGVGRLIDCSPDGAARRLRVETPAELSRFIARKGSVCVDGISLTVNAAEDTNFELTIIPHTLAATTLGNCAAGQRVNLEVDLIARYVERLLAGKVRQ